LGAGLPRSWEGDEDLEKPVPVQWQAPPFKPQARRVHESAALDGGSALQTWPGLRKAPWACEGGGSGGAAAAAAVKVVLRVRPRMGLELMAPEVVGLDERSRSATLKGVTYRFDAVLGPGASQQDVYEQHCRPLVEAFLSGQNATLLAYGQTGSGKTYTMGTAAEGDEGCLPRALAEVFRGLGRPDGLAQREVSCQFMEIYNEDIRDLLNPRTPAQNIRIRESMDGEISVSALREVPVRRLEDAMGLFQAGCASRAIGKTKANQRSSRSHAVFTLQLRTVAEGVVTAGSKLHIVDLAGSERNKKTGAVGKRFKEAININKGLLALGNVISALSSHPASKHIPYRDSKITRILQDSLGGTHRTCMVACVSPTHSSAEETANTLKYASRARNIRNSMPPPVLDESAVAEFLVAYAEGRVPDSIGIPEAVTRNLTRTAAVSAVRRLREGTKEELAAANSARGLLDQQVALLQQLNRDLVIERNSLRQQLAEAKAGPRQGPLPGAPAEAEQQQRSELAACGYRAALEALQGAARDPRLNESMRRDLEESVREVLRLDPSGALRAGSPGDTWEWRSHPLSNTVSVASHPGAGSLQGLARVTSPSVTPPSAASPRVADLSLGGSPRTSTESVSGTSHGSGSTASLCRSMHNICRESSVVQTSVSFSYCLDSPRSCTAEASEVEPSPCSKTAHRSTGAPPAPLAAHDRRSSCSVVFNHSQQGFQQAAGAHCRSPSWHVPKDSWANSGTAGARLKHWLLKMLP